MIPDLESLISRKPDPNALKSGLKPLEHFLKIVKILEIPEIPEVHPLKEI